MAALEIFSANSRNHPAAVLNISLNFPYSAKEWNDIYGHLIHLLDYDEFNVWEQAIDCLVDAVKSESSQYSECNTYKACSLERRLRTIFLAIVEQASRKSTIFERFCFKFKTLMSEPRCQTMVLEWLDQLSQSENLQSPSSDAILSAQILLGLYDSTWQVVGETLIDMLDSPDLTIRACAAYQIGKFYCKAFFSEIALKDQDRLRYGAFYEASSEQQDQLAVVGMPSLASIRELIYRKEVERPGVAGAFWEVIPQKRI